MASLVFAAIGIPTADQCLRLLAPIAALFGLRWLWHNFDGVIHRFFPDWEWERRLGWFNIRAQRQAGAFLRGVAYLAYFLLAAALLGIVWGAEGLSHLRSWRDPEALLEIENRLLLLLACGGLWAFYLGSELIPSLRHEYEEEELRRFRAELRTPEEEEEREPARTPRPSAVKPPFSQRPRR